MLYLNIAILTILIIFLVVSWKEEKDWLNVVDKKEHKLYLLYPLAKKILTKTRVEPYLQKKEKVTGAITALYIRGKPEIVSRLYWYQKTSLVIIVVIIFNILSILGQLQSRKEQGMLEGQNLLRPGYGEGSKEADLKVYIHDVDDQYTEEIPILVKEREYTRDEFQVVLKDAIPVLKKAVLGENLSSSQVEKDLNFLSFIPETSIQIDWYPDDYELITGHGIVMNEDIEKAVSTTVTAVFLYKEYQYEHVMGFHVLPKKLSKKELIKKELRKELQNQSEQSRNDRIWKLPDHIGEIPLRWEENIKSNGALLFFLGFFVAVLAWVYGDKELDKKMKKRKDQMLIDYPEIINKFNLLLNAGMTIKQAWSKIAEDYFDNVETDSKKMRYAYEEMLITVHELRLGVPEVIAYEQFGRRTGILPYLKFSSLIAQNLKKGNRGLSELLSREAIDAFEERKELAKRLGEEAGTKLLLPMMILLIIVFAIIMVPAFMSFGI